MAQITQLRHLLSILIPPYNISVGVRCELQVLLQHTLIDISSLDTSPVMGSCLHWACYGDNGKGLARSVVDGWPFELSYD